MALTRSSNVLTEKESCSTGEEKILLIACGALAHEILALKCKNNWQHMDLQCLPAKLHLWPDQIPAAVEAEVLKKQDKYGKIFVVYADCGTGGRLKATCERLSVGMIAGPHCYSFFEGNDTFAAHADSEATAFYLTDFLVRQFDSFVWKPMGLDQHLELRETYFGHYTKLIYLAQTNDPLLDKKAQNCADRLSLDYERRFTGYGDLSSALKDMAKSIAP